MKTAITLLLGAWLTGTIVVAFVAAENFFMIDRLLQSPVSPEFHRDAAALPAGEARVMLRHLSSELNRYYFRVWGWTELLLGGLVLWLAFRGLRQKKFVIGFSIMLVSVAVMTLYITPRITVLGRAVDFVPRNPPPPGMAEFGILHGAYSALDLLKLLMGIWMAVALIRSERH
ncbi:MAG: hypothetical protein HYX72_09140 [Acidobacteria bacterium]|nr:hypothetical protein [Acidobacteriota bacterium]